MRLARVPGVRRVPPLLSRAKEHVVLFDSWGGQYADNPRAIFEELQRREAPFEHVWVLDDPSALRPEGVATVAPGSRGHLEATGRARYIVSNNSMPGYFRKKRRSTYLQTWHGTPLKRIAFDLQNPSFPDSKRYLAELERDVARWDLLISPNRFSTDIFRGAFRFDGTIIETGYPRNDVMSSSRRDQIRAAARAELGIGEHERVVLYAPTWRDNSRFTTELDLSGMAAELGDDHVFLLRAHHLVSETFQHEPDARVRDVSGYPDIRELYLAADVLITDYSSVMFDFAVTLKPMLFFTYDLDVYRDQLRGFYFDFEAEAPGPLLHTTSEVVEALRDLDTVTACHADAYSRFSERFCRLDDGRAAARVVDAVFGL